MISVFPLGKAALGFSQTECEVEEAEKKLKMLGGGGNKRLECSEAALKVY